MLSLRHSRVSYSLAAKALLRLEVVFVDVGESASFAAKLLAAS